MNGMLNQLLGMCVEIWKSIGIAQRVSIILITALGVSAIGGLIYLGTRPNWQVLYADLDRATAAKVYEIATEEKVPVMLRDGGSTVMVPFEHVSRLRMRVAKAEVAIDSPGVGWELFDNVKMGMTSMQQRVGYQRALQGELQRMIRQMPGVEDARVVVVSPEQRVLKTAKMNVKASVMVVTRRGYSLEPAQVAGIRSMVAGAVEGMSPGDVTITDRLGRVLARGSSDDTAGFGDSATQQEVREQMEMSLKEKAEAILRPLVGIDSVVAMASVDLDFSGGDRQIETYDSNNAVILSERVVTEENSKAGRPAGGGGAAGVAANVVSVRNPGGGAGGSSEMSEQNRKTMENQYAVPRTTERISLRGPRLRGLNVAVTIARADDGSQRPAETLESYRKLVMSAVGGIERGADQRQDVITLVEESFVPVPVLMDEINLSGVQRLQQLIEEFGSLSFMRPLMGLILLLGLYYVFGSSFRSTQVENYDLNHVGYNDNLRQVQPGNMSGNIEARPESAKIISSKADSDPEMVAGALRAWLGGSR